MAEQFRFRQAFGQRAAVDGQKRLVATRAMVMQIAGDHLLTGAGFADDQHGRLRGRQFVQQALKRFDAGSISAGVEDGIQDSAW
jgi:hypothetical protein